MQNNIKRIRQQLGLSQQELAERMGVGWQTISNVERGVTGLSSKKLDAYAEALGVSPQDLIAADDGARRVAVIGHVQAGHFAASWEFDEADQYEVHIPNDARFRHFKLQGAEVRGPSMNRRYPEGTVLVFTDAVETGEDVVDGRRYIIERERADGMREATVKVLWRDNEGRRWLLPESDDPRFQEPIPLEGSDGETIRIVGRVRYSVARED